MQEKHLKTLEYDRILEILATHSQTYLGKELCLHLKPKFQNAKVETLLSETSEAISFQCRKGNCPFGFINDISLSLKQLKSNITLSASSLLQIANILKSSREMKSYFFDNEDIPVLDYPILNSYFELLYRNDAIEDRIFNSILDENTLSDTASSSLSDIRRKIKRTEQVMRDKLSSFLQTHSKYMQELVVTIRNDRYVVPVKEEYRSMIKGFVHDISSSGSTIFIEPLSVFDLNNEISNLKVKETIEIERILQELTALLLPVTEFLEQTIEVIGKLDFAFTKAKYALSQNAIIPILNQDKKIHLEKARHPLIASDKVVPITLSLGYDFSCLVITGPNTGGKTVTLKTVGLLCLMAMSGLAIPAEEKSSVYVFDAIYADIGDEQSIGDSLSTFSSHLTTIIEITKEMTQNSLLLLDELGSGTDPIEGSSLAISLLEFFYQKQAFIIATTHYPEIKNYALITDGFENASCVFDVETLSPTYHLLIGVPGKSNAFAISRKLGLEESILKRASDFLEKDTISIEELLKSIYDNKKQIETEKSELEKNLSQIRLLRKSLEKEVENKKEKEDAIIQKAKLQARTLLEKAKEEVAFSLKQLDASHTTSKDLEHLRNHLNTSLKDLSISSPSVDKQVSNAISNPLVLGQKVMVTTLGQIGTVLSLPNHSNQVQVQIGSIKTHVPLANLSSVSSDFKDTTSSISHQSPNATSLKSQNVSTEINVIGQNVEEATFVIDKYLDDCSLSRLSTVRIVHGKGTGKLREGIHTFLKKHPHVKSFRLGTFGEGEMGVTIVTLK